MFQDKQGDSEYVYWNTAVRIDTYKNIMNGNKERGSNFS